MPPLGPNTEFFISPSLFSGDFTIKHCVNQCQYCVNTANVNVLVKNLLFLTSGPDKVYEEKKTC